MGICLGSGGLGILYKFVYNEKHKTELELLKWTFSFARYYLPKSVPHFKGDQKDVSDSSLKFHRQHAVTLMLKTTG